MAESVSSEVVVSEVRGARFWLVVGSATAILFGLFAIAVPRSDGVAQFDQNMLMWLSDLRRPALTSVVQFITELGTYRPVTVLSIALALILGYRTQRLLEPLVLLLAVEASSSLVDLFKMVVDRARPPLGGMLGAPVFDYSFPSGHTGASTVLYILGAVLLAQTQTRNFGRRQIIAGGCVLAVLIGLSRVYLGYHWLTDVVGSWLLALIITSIGMALITAIPRPKWPIEDRTEPLLRRWVIGPSGSPPETDRPQRSGAPGS
jgi:membrane-associated phospholipid phosphatase